MRDWLWRSLMYSAVGFGATPWDYLPPEARQSFIDALFGPPASQAVDTGPRRRPHRTRKREGLTAECEALLTGHYFDLLTKDRRRAVPGWVWVNPLAHAEQAELERLAQLRTSPHDPLAFLSYLADEVLLGTGREESVLQRVQHDRLVPLELDLLRSTTIVPDRPTLARIIRDRCEVWRPSKRAIG